MMKRLFLALIAISFTAPAFAAATPSPLLSKSVRIETLQTEDEDYPVPWPWGAEAPFPWMLAQGVWLAERGQFKSIYVFKVIRRQGGIFQMQVSQVDPLSCVVVATGVGYEQNRVVRAQMTVPSERKAYRLSLRSFPERAVPKVQSAPKPIHGQYLVLSIVPFDSTKTTAMPIQLLTNQLIYRCPKISTAVSR